MSHRSLTSQLPKFTYRSKKVLGTLFRRVDGDLSFEPSDLRKIAYEVDTRIYGHPHYKEVMSRLRNVKNGYECDMHFAMRRFRATELEIVSGIVTYDKARRTARDISNASVGAHARVCLTFAGVPEGPLSGHHAPLQGSSEEEPGGASAPLGLHSHATGRRACVPADVRTPGGQRVGGQRPEAHLGA